MNSISTDNESMPERLVKYCNLLFKTKDIRKTINERTTKIRIRKTQK